MSIEVIGDDYAIANGFTGKYIISEEKSEGDPEKPTYKRDVQDTIGNDSYISYWPDYHGWRVGHDMTHFGYSYKSEIINIGHW